MKFLLQHKIFLILLLGLLVSFIAKADAQPNPASLPIIKIGMLAKRGSSDAVKKWQPTADYLSKQIPERKFSIVPLDFDQINQAMREHSIDFVVTNSGMYVEMEYQYGARRIATLKNQRLGKAYTSFGGVIFTRADRSDISQLQDIKGKRFMAVDEESLGGWQMSWLTFKHAGIDPYHDFAELKFGGTHDKVVYAVLDGTVDAGTVRTDTLEQMANEGKIKLNDIVVINSQFMSPDFPFVRSTKLYPEWPFAASSHVNEDLIKKVTVALLNMPEQSQAAQAAESQGWTTAFNYEPVHQLFRELQIGHYKYLSRLTWRSLFDQYLLWTISVSLTFLSLCVATIVFQLRAIKHSRKLAEVLKASEELANQQAQKLEIAVNERTQELAQAHVKISVLYEKLQADNTRLSAELDVAKQIQSMILPRAHELTAIKELDIACYMQPADEVGGDYYDVLSFDGHIILGIGDVTGHGLESGVIMLMVQSAVRSLMENNNPDLCRSLCMINQVVYKNSERMETDKNLSLALLHYCEGKLTIAGQHEEVLVVKENQVQRLDTIDLGFPIGLEEDVSDFMAETEIHLAVGDGVVLYTDGITEAANMQGELFGIQRLQDLVAAHWHEDAQKLQEIICQAISYFIGEQKVYDDITLLIIKRR